MSENTIDYKELNCQKTYSAGTLRKIATLKFIEYFVGWSTTHAAKESPETR